MKQRPRIYYTESQKALMWERWRKGESLQQIAHLLIGNARFARHGVLLVTLQRVGYVTLRFARYAPHAAATNGRPRRCR